MKIVIAKMVGEGEQITIEMSATGDALQDFRKGKKETLVNFLAPAFFIMDSRLLALNQRILDSMGYLNKLPEDIRGHASYAAKAAVDLLYGKQPGPQAQPIPQEVIEKDKEAITKAMDELDPETKLTVIQGGKSGSLPAVDDVAGKVEAFLSDPPSPA